MSAAAAPRADGNRVTLPTMQLSPFAVRPVVGCLRPE